MTISPFSIAAVVTRKALDHILEAAGSSAAGAYRDTHPWYVARELLQTCRERGERVPIVLATDAPFEFSHWGFIDDVDVEEFHRGTWETRCTFSGIAPVNPIFVEVDSVALYPSAEQRHREAIEPVTMHRQFLDEHLIRPYAVCETPPFILNASGEAGGDAENA